LSTLSLYRDKSGEVQQLPARRFTVFAWRQLAEFVRAVRLKTGAMLRIECVWQRNGETKPALIAVDLKLVEDLEACSSLDG
jgi:hypothetical protein